MVNLGKYTIPMDIMGYRNSVVFFLTLDFLVSAILPQNTLGHPQLAQHNLVNHVDGHLVPWELCGFPGDLTTGMPRRQRPHGCFQK